MRLRVFYAKAGLVRFISHRDLMRVIFRGVRRAGLPVAYSQGYNPHPRVEFCPPLSLGMEGLGEELEARLEREILPAQAVSGLNRCWPPGIRAIRAERVEDGAPGLSRLLSGAVYRICPAGAAGLEPAGLAAFLAAGSIPYTRKGAEGEKEIDARSGVRSLQFGSDGLKMEIALEGGPRPLEVLAVLLGKRAEDLAGVKMTRIGFTHRPGLFSPGRGNGVES